MCIPLLLPRGRIGSVRPRRLRALLGLSLLLPLAACGPGELEPTRLTSRAGLDASVLKAIDGAYARAVAAPADAEAHGMLGLAFQVNERSAEAVESYAHAAKLDSSDPVWPFHSALCRRSLGDTDAAMAELDEVVRRFPDLAQARFRRGDWRLQAGDLDGALADFEAAVRAAPDEARMGIGLAAALLEHEEYKRAIDVLTEALESRPDDGAAHFLRGRAYRAVGRLDEAESEMALGLGAELSYPGTRLDGMRDRYLVGKAALIEEAFELMNADRAPEAIAILERARRAYPNDVAVLNDLGAVYHRDGQNKKYLAVIQEAEKLDSNFAPTFINLAFAHLELIQPREALNAARHAVLLTPNDAQGQFALGRSKLALRDVTGAYFALTRAVELDPQLTVARGYLVEVCMATERWPESKEHLIVMCRDLPNYLPHAINLGQVSLVVGDMPAALAALEHARRIQPDHPRVLALAAKISEAR